MQMVHNLKKIWDSPKRRFYDGIFRVKRYGKPYGRYPDGAHQTVFNEEINDSEE